MNFIYLFICLSIFTSIPAFASAFNTRFIHGGHAQNLELFDSDISDDYIPVGNYDLQFIFNGKKYGRHSLYIKDNTIDDYCVPAFIFEDNGINLNKTFFKDIYNEEDKCYKIAHMLNASISFSLPKLTLEITLPQAGLNTAVDDNVSYWNYGNTGFNFRYIFNSNRTSYGQSDVFGSVTGDVSLGRWIITAYGYKNDKSDIELPTWMARTAIGSIGGDITFGKLQLLSSAINSFAYNGIRVSSNEQMKPNGKSFFSPKISGIARSNARVEIWQNDYLLFSQMFPPGPFDIRDISALGNGELVLKVKEQDGTEYKTIYPVTIMQNMLTDTDSNYDISVGQKDTQIADKKEYFSYFSYERGFPLLTLNAMALLNNNYLNVGVGSALSLGYIGGVSLSFNMSEADYKHNNKNRGNSFSIKYAKSLTKSTDLQLIGYQYSGAGYVEFADYAEVRSDNNLNKNRYELQVSQRFGSLNMATTYWRQTYWNSQSNEGLNLSLSFPYKTASLSLTGIYQTRDNYHYRGSNYGKVVDRDNFNLGLSLHVPFDFFERKTYISNNSKWDERRGLYNTTSVNSSVNDNLSYNVGITNGGNNKSQFVSAGYNFDSAALRASFSNSNDGYRSANIQLSGSILQASDSYPVFTGKTLNSFALINVGNVEGVSLNRFNKTDSHGNTVIGLNPYKRNLLTFDTDTLPENITLDKTALHIFPTEDSKHYIKVSHKKTSVYILEVFTSAEMSSHLETNSIALDGAGNQISFVDSSGLLYLSLPSATKGINIVSSEGKCFIPLDKVNPGTNSIHKVVCKK